MNLEMIKRAALAVVGFVIATLIFIVLTVAVKFATPVPAIDAARGAERAKDLAEIRAVENTGLNNPGWVDQSRGIVRLPIDQAMKLAEQAWQDPAKARADLTAREEKASAPAPKAPEQPSAFE